MAGPGTIWLASQAFTEESGENGRKGTDSRVTVASKAQN
jgi:hypothetical protein